LIERTHARDRVLGLTPHARGADPVQGLRTGFPDWLVGRAQWTDPGLRRVGHTHPEGPGRIPYPPLIFDLRSLPERGGFHEYIQQ